MAEKEVKKKSKAGLIVVGVLLVLVAAVYIGGALYFQGRYFLPRTVVNGEDVSMKTAADVKADIMSEVDDYTLTITGRKNITDTVKSSDVDMTMDMGTSVEDALNAQNTWLWPVLVAQGQNLNLTGTIKYDETKLESVISGMNCKDEKQALAPVNAHISEFDETNGFTVVPEEENNQLDDAVFLTLVQNAITDMDTDITEEDLENADAYKKAEILQDDESLNAQVTALNKYCKVKLTYKFGSDKVVVTGQTIADWLTFDKNYKAKFDKDKVLEFVASLARKYDTMWGVTRKFKTSYGTTIKISNGNYGWWMDRGSTRDELIKAIKKGEDKTLEPVYYQKGASHSSKDWGNTYVEINLTAQHLFLYKNGKCILESDIVSGNPSKKDTPTGIYAITYKETVHTMNGTASDPYRVETYYWMPFCGNVGMHDATWRTSFGGQVYLSNGSHGCVNLPYNTAKKIYNTLDKSSPVIVYKMDGTATSSTSTQSSKEIAQIAIEAIERIGTVENTAACRERVRWARQVYTDLSSSQRAYVTNYSTLTAAESKLG